MNEKVVPLHTRPAGQRDAHSSLPAAAHSLNLPSLRHAHQEIKTHLSDLGLTADAMGLWLGYPNLKASVEQLLTWVSIDWPSLTNPGNSAVQEAVGKAIMSVKEGLDRQETDKRFVIANFHNGLSTIANDLAEYQAWGCIAGKAVAQWEPFDAKFVQWCETGKFETVVFSRVDKCNQIDRDGLAWKMLSNIAPVKDVGVMHRYGGR